MANEETVHAPDFSAMYGQEESLLSPRMAEVLWGTALLLSELYRQPDSLEDLKEELPPVVRRLADEVWLARFTRCFARIAGRLSAGCKELSRLASCTGEEMALHLVIDAAENGVCDGSMSLDESLPADEEHDHDFDWAREVLFRDHDVLLLYEDSLDGIEDSESELSRRYRFANLHPMQWFLPFADALGE